jgi:hypothetical protein
MSETDNKTEDKRAVQNKTILDLCNGSLCKYVTRQSMLDAPSLDDIDRIIKISNHFSGRVLLDDGKNTANLGLDVGAGGFNVTFIETVAALSDDATGAEIAHALGDDDLDDDGDGSEGDE